MNGHFLYHLCGMYHSAATPVSLFLCNRIDVAIFPVILSTERTRKPHASYNNQKPTSESPLSTSAITVVKLLRPGIRLDGVQSRNFKHSLLFMTQGRGARERRKRRTVLWHSSASKE
ncbi:hypothetical protein H8959_001877 [Pygathrix nigripes]